MTQIVSRLALLMQVLDVTGYDVAIALGIDPSLISKWKRNRRRVPGRTDTMQKIAGYLLDADERQGCRTIIPMLESIADQKEITRSRALELLTQWLLEPELPTWFSDVDSVSNVNLEQNSYTCTMEVFNGIIGRQNAILRFFEITRGLPADCLMQLQLQEDSDWIDSSVNFLLQFKAAIRSWLGTGRQLEIVYWLDRQPDRLQQMIHSWLTMHLEASLTAWYSPFYGKDSFPITLLLVPGQLALIGVQSGEGPGDYHTVLYSDQSTIHQFSWMFKQVKLNCKPLIECFDPVRINELIENFIKNWQDAVSKSINIYSKLPLMLCLPAEHERHSRTQ